ncbi:OmpA family protein [Nitrosomonas ureae]|uniref:Outer membrane protein OmpA n=1 Tax=Nitrosomonas ureae TaxID=44577 RepID=A0A1H5UTH9_9PROT|nr:OmpA family protein [Nitrosomonas ureae]SEF78373.1 Outer membrane protein OmpA [Nitrosomonas ureae]
MVRFIIIGLSVVFFSLSAVVMFKALETPVQDTIYQGNWPEAPSISESTSTPASSSISPSTSERSINDLIHSPEIQDDEHSIFSENIEKTITQDENISIATEEIIDTTPPPDVIDKPRTLAIFDGKTFRSGQDIIHDVSHSIIDNLIKEISASPNSRILIEGHTDNIPTGKTSSDNMDLSRRRARAIANILILHGVPVTRVSIIGYGDKRPIASNATNEGRTKNRRVEVKLMPQEGAN